MARSILQSISETKVSHANLEIRRPLTFSVGGAPVTSWVYRACVIQGTQQIYVVALWYWGSELTKAAQHSATGSSPAVASKAAIIPIGILIACLMWAVGTVLFIGLPKYYRQAPGYIPSFYASLFKRRIILVRSPANVVVDNTDLA